MLADLPTSMHQPEPKKRSCCQKHLYFDLVSVKNLKPIVILSPSFLTIFLMILYTDLLYFKVKKSSIHSWSTAIFVSCYWNSVNSKGRQTVLNCMVRRLWTKPSDNSCFWNYVGRGMSGIKSQWAKLTSSMVQEVMTQFTEVASRSLL